MPVRIADIPGLAADNGFHPPQADFNVAEAPAKALSGVARSVSDLGETFTEIAHKVQEQEDQTAASEMRSDWSRSQADATAEISQDPDPNSRLKKWDDFLRQKQEGLDSPQVSPRLRASLQPQFNQWADGVYRASRQDAFALTQHRADEATQSEMNGAQTQGEFEAAFDSRVHAGLADPGQKAKAVEAWKGKMADQARMTEATTDWDGYLDSHPIEPPKGENPVKWTATREQALRARNAYSQEVGQQILEGISGNKITTPEQIDAIGARLQPTIRDSLKQALEQRKSAQAMDRMRDPEHQKDVRGQFSGGLAEYKPTLEGTDEAWVNLASLAYQVPDGPMRQDMLRALDKARSNGLEEAATHADLAQQILAERYRQGAMGDITSTGESDYQVAPLVNDGFLRAEAKLTGVGLSPDQAKAVSWLDEDALERSLRVGRTEDEAKQLAASLSGDKTDANRQRAFQLIYGSRQGQATGTAFEQATANAIYGGNSSFRYGSDESRGRAFESKARAMRALGDAQAELSSWLKLNPKATNDEIDQHVFEIAGAEARRQLQEAKLPQASIRSLAHPPGDSSPKDLRELVRSFAGGDTPDGFHRKAYLDDGQQRIGYGTPAKGEDDTVDQAEAEHRLDAELARRRLHVDRVATAQGYHFSEAQKDALTSFDLTGGKLEELLVANGHRSDAEIADAMRHYHFAGPQSQPGLQRRRAAEAGLFTNGYR